MKRNKAVIILSFGLLLAAVLFSFKNSSATAKQAIVLRQYSSSDADFGNQIIICYPDGKVKKQALLQSKHQNYEMNDKMFAQALNEVLSTGAEMKSFTSTGDSHLMVTTYIFE